MSFILVALLTLLCQKIHQSNAFNSFAGSYIAVIDERGAYTCERPNDQILWGWNWRTSHFNPNRPREKQLLTGNITGVNVTIDDSWWATVNVDSYSNNQWKENALVFPFKNKACTVFKQNIPSLYNVFYKNQAINSECRFKPGVYTANNTPLDLVFPNFPILPYGRYRIRATAGKAENLFACFGVHARAIPKMF